MILRRRCNGAKYDAEASGYTFSVSVGERSLLAEGERKRELDGREVLMLT